MTSEAVENTEVEVQDDTGFASGFAEVRGDEPPIDVEPQQEEVSEAQVEQPVQEEVPLIAGLSEDQWKALALKAGQVDDMAAKIEKAFGKFGEIQRTMGEMQKRPGIQLSPDKMKRTFENYPELAEDIANDLNEVLGAVGGGSQPAFDPSEVDSIVNQRLADKEIEINQAIEKRWLRREHKDWESVVTSDDFKLWMQNVLPPEEANRLGGSWDAEFIGEKLTEFKGWREKSSTTRENKQKRLEAAVIPPTGGAKPNNQSDDDAFATGFNQVRSNRMY